MEFVERPMLDEQLWVKFDGLQPIEAEVCWVEAFTVGVNFQPIHPAVFDRLVSGLGPLAILHDVKPPFTATN